MPGLLQVPPERFGKSKYYMAAACEFFANVLFGFTGSCILATALSRDPPDVVLAGLGNGLALALCIYCVANCSGGHITPSVTIATMITGHITFFHGLLYMFAQFTGACFGSLLVAGLVPNVYIGMGNEGAAYGCDMPHTDGITHAQVFGFELLISFILVFTAYAVAIGEPNFGNIGPLMVGLSLSLDVFAAGVFSGAGVSPARVFGPAIVYHCRWNVAWIYLLGDMVGGIVAGLAAVPLYGSHAVWLDKLMPWSHHHDPSLHPKYKVESPAYMEPEAAHTQPLENEDSAHMGNHV